MNTILEGTKRKAGSRSNLSGIRNSGGIPANVYGYRTEATPISVDTKSYPVKIEYEQTLLAVPLIQLPDLDELEIALQKDFEQVMEKCQALKTDPFFLAEKAAGNFRTIEKFLQFGWNHHFAEADIRIKIHIRELKE